METWVTPPKADAEFVAHPEAVLDTYATPYDPRVPGVCVDEQPVQLLKETRVPMPAAKEHPRRVDYEYERAGVASLFVFREPLVGWRQVTARGRRTKADEGGLGGRGGGVADRPVRGGGEGDPGVRPPEHAHDRGVLRGVRPGHGAGVGAAVGDRHTPKHGSWLNVAECELSAMTRQCVTGRRFGTLDELRAETTAWQVHTNDRQRGVDWQFHIDDARVKLKSLDPKLVL